MTTTTDHGERLARLEGAYEHLATKADIERLQATIIKWFVGIGLAVATVASVLTSAILTWIAS